jgi:hypothetical protein
MTPNAFIASCSEAAEIYTPAGAAEENAAEDKFIVTGAVRPIKGRGTNENKPAYELIDGNNEIYKLIGPKSILDQIISIKNFEELKFKITGRLIKKDKKKGILMSGFEIYNTPPADDKLLNAPDSTATGENAIKSIDNTNLLNASENNSK